MTSATVVVRQPLVSGDGRTATATIELPAETREVVFCASKGPLSSRADPFLALALLPAMRLGATLRVEGRASPLLVQNLDVLQDIYHAWDAGLQRVAVEVAIAPPAPLPAAPGVGCFFGGDASSFYTFCKNRAAITHVVVSPGLDTPRQAAATIGQAAAELGAPVLVVESNARAWLDDYGDWRTLMQGAARVAVAHLLAPQFSQMYIPGEIPYYRLVPYGSQPLTDRLWQSEAMRLVHDGAEATPWQKAVQVLDKPVVRRCLRLCRSDSADNCGTCADCLPMMALLRATGRAGEVSTLPPLVDLDLLRAMPLSTRTERAALDELRLLLAEVGGAPDVIAALDDCLNRYEAPEHELHWTIRMRSAQAALFAARDELKSARSSLSWRLTAPLRALGQALRRPS
jgi:hypothetical protein